jgi:hypothetical protein
LHHRPTGGGVRVDVLGKAFEACAALLQALDDGKEVLERSRDAVELIDD